MPGTLADYPQSSSWNIDHLLCDNSQTYWNCFCISTQFDCDGRLLALKVVNGGHLLYGAEFEAVLTLGPGSSAGPSDLDLGDVCSPSVTQKSTQMHQT